MATLKLLDFDSREDLDISLAREVASLLEQAINARGSASLAVSGGKTPSGFFQQLRQIRIDWSKVWITLADDRWLNADHADSNERLVRENLFKYAVEAANFISLKSSAATPELGLAEVEARFANVPQPFDVVVLGMGEDGHTASLFPCSAELESAADINNPHLLAAVNPTTAPYPRISFTLAALAKARQPIVHITGEKKLELFRAVTAADATNLLPLRRVLDANPAEARVYWAA